MDTRDDDALYEKYVKPLGLAHRDEYIGVSHQGHLILAATLLEAVRKSADAFGKNNSVVFRVGEKVVGRVLDAR